MHLERVVGYVPLKALKALVESIYRPNFKGRLYKTIRVVSSPLHEPTQFAVQSQHEFVHYLQGYRIEKRALCHQKTDRCLLSCTLQSGPSSASVSDFARSLDPADLIRAVIEWASGRMQYALHVTCKRCRIGEVAVFLNRHADLLDRTDSHHVRRHLLIERAWTLNDSGYGCAVQTPTRRRSRVPAVMANLVANYDAIRSACFGSGRIFI